MGLLLAFQGPNLYTGSTSLLLWAMPATVFLDRIELREGRHQACNELALRRSWLSPVPFEPLRF